MELESSNLRIERKKPRGPKSGSQKSKSKKQKRWVPVHGARATKHGGKVNSALLDALAEEKGHRDALREKLKELDEVHTSDPPRKTKRPRPRRPAVPTGPEGKEEVPDEVPRAETIPRTLPGGETLMAEIARMRTAATAIVADDSDDDVPPGAPFPKFGPGVPHVPGLHAVGKGGTFDADSPPRPPGGDNPDGPYNISEDGLITNYRESDIGKRLMKIEWGRYRFHWWEILLSLLLAFLFMSSLATGIAGYLAYETMGEQKTNNGPDNLRVVPSVVDRPSVHWGWPVAMAGVWLVALIATVAVAIRRPPRYENQIRLDRIWIYNVLHDYRPDMHALSDLRHENALMATFVYKRFPSPWSFFCCEKPKKAVLRVSLEMVTQAFVQKVIEGRMQPADVYRNITMFIGKEQKTNRDRYSVLSKVFSDEDTKWLLYGLFMEMREQRSWWDFPSAPVSVV
jgi:hypothetical protein